MNIDNYIKLTRKNQKKFKNLKITNLNVCFLKLNANFQKRNTDSLSKQTDG